MVLPATVVDPQRASLAASWQQTRGSFWRILIGGVLTIAPLYLAQEGLDALQGLDIRENVRAGNHEIFTPVFISIMAVRWILAFVQMFVWASLEAWLFRSLPPQGVSAG